MLTKQQVERIKTLLSAGHTVHAIGIRVGVSRESVRRVKNGTRSDRFRAPDALTILEQRLNAADLSDRPDSPEVYLPSEEEIRVLCGRFRRLRPRRPVGARAAHALRTERGTPC